MISPYTILRVAAGSMSPPVSTLANAKLIDDDTSVLVDDQGNELITDIPEE